MQSGREDGLFSRAVLCDVHARVHRQSSLYFGYFSKYELFSGTDHLLWF